MSALTIADFDAYFRELHHCEPYDWQARLTKQVVERTWPPAIDLPTGSGKTACLDIAVFALACQASWEKGKRTAPRRVFFCVNRRVIVDEAYQRALRIAEAICEAERSPPSLPVLSRVATALRQLSSARGDGGPPLDVLELRGGIYRDNRWARSATQPTIICTTIDQLGSRLLFRGYGVSENAAPIQAALIAYDSLVLLDEAHISQPFSETLGHVRRYLDPGRWAKERLGVLPMLVVPMTATPPNGVDEADVIKLNQKDRESVNLDDRLKAAKLARLLKVPDITNAAVTEAKAVGNNATTAVGIIVNRVATAKKIYSILRSERSDDVVELVIGSMRPVDRDQQSDRLRLLVGPNRPKVTTQPSFVIATQCLEVGADYDFDALITECASLDALRQRFGRLNRGGRKISAQAAILIDNTQIKEESQFDDDKPIDPIYGNALSRTWNWLFEHADADIEVRDSQQAASRRRRSGKIVASDSRRIDFGIDAFTAILQRHGERGRIPAKLLAPSASSVAPVMLPAYVDIWCQTNPRPTPDPEVSLFLHGAKSGEPDVQVCWRADLVEEGTLQRSDWCDVVSLLPPTAAECMSVPISRLRHWLTDETTSSDQSDLLGAPDSVPMARQSRKGRANEERRPLDARVGVLWRGARKGKSVLIQSPDELRPGDTLVLPARAEGWNEFGHRLPDAPDDVAETAFCQSRDRAALRLHPALKSQLPDVPAIGTLLERIADPTVALRVAEIQQLLDEAAAEPSAGRHGEALRCLANARMGFTREIYPDGLGIVLITRRRIGSATAWYLPNLDDGEDEYCRTTRQLPVSLSSHTQHVREEVLRVVAALPLDDLSDPYRLAADLHDLGKADERFQAMLRRTDRTDAWLRTTNADTLLAKSDAAPQTPRQRKEARERAGLPDGFRHEALSVQIAERVHGFPISHAHRDLVLHVIAAHHGYGRPFTPVVIDDDPPDVSVEGVELRARDRKLSPPHRIDSGIAERFWTLTRRYGWWGLAYLETVLRLADQQASAAEDAGIFDADNSSSVPVGVTS